MPSLHINCLINYGRLKYFSFTTCLSLWIEGIIYIFFFGSNFLVELITQWFKNHKLVHGPYRSSPLQYTKRDLYSDIPLHHQVFLFIQCTMSYHHNLSLVWSAGLLKFSCLLKKSKMGLSAGENVLVICIPCQEMLFFLPNH